jgi:hypothetical protein
MINWSKTIKKYLTKLVPKGAVKEFIKLNYYNIVSLNRYKFKILDNGIFKTKSSNVEINTHEALYHIAPDFDYYQHFYKIKNGDFIIDTGANFGHLTIYFAKKKQV